MLSRFRTGFRRGEKEDGGWCSQTESNETIQATIPARPGRRVRQRSGPTRTGISTRQDDQERPLPDRSGMRASQGLKNRLSDVQADKRLLHSCKGNLAEQSLESPCL